MNKVERFLATSHPRNTYEETLQRFLKQRYDEDGISTSSVNRYFYSLIPLAELCKTASELSRQKVEAYMAERRLSVKIDTVRTQVGDLREFGKWLYNNRHTDKNVCVGLKPIKRRNHRGKQSKATPEPHLSKIIEHLALLLKDNLWNPEPLVYRDIFNKLQPNFEREWLDRDLRALRDILAVTMLYETGMRVGELVNLSSQHMDEITKNRQEVYIVIVWGKTEYRDRFFTEKTAELWRVWQQVRPEGNRKNAIVGWRVNQPAKAIQSNGISHMLVRRCKQFQIPVFRANSIRHSKIKRTRRRVGLDIAKELVDHSALESTENYANFEDSELAQAAIITGLETDLWT